MNCTQNSFSYISLRRALHKQKFMKVSCSESSGAAALTVILEFLPRREYLNCTSINISISSVGRILYEKYT